jgi:hypothetical protein
MKKMNFAKGHFEREYFFYPELHKIGSGCGRAALFKMFLKTNQILEKKPSKLAGSLRAC